MLRSTVSVETPEGIELQLPVAGIVVRSMAWAIDFSLRMLIYIVLLVVAGSAIVRSIFENLAGIREEAAYIAGIASIVFFLFEWFFTAIPEALYGTTPGKKLMGLRVVHIDGTPIGWQSAVLRNFLRFADFLPFLYFSAVISMLLDKRSRRLGDLAASTMVVYQHTKVAATLEQVSVGGSLPALALTSAERAAILDFDERCSGLTESRQIELAQILTHLDIGSGMQAVNTLRSWASWIRSGQLEAANEHTSAA